MADSRYFFGRAASWFGAVSGREGSDHTAQVQRGAVPGRATCLGGPAAGDGESNHLLKYYALTALRVNTTRGILYYRNICTGTPIVRVREGLQRLLGNWETRYNVTTFSRELP